MGRTILQFDKHDLDAAGVPKFDFLGLGGLSAVRHAFDAIEPVATATRGKHRSQETDGGATVADKQIRIRRRNFATCARYLNRARFPIVAHGDANPTERLDHHLRVFAFQGANKLRGAVSESRADQCPVRNALGTGRTNASFHCVGDFRYGNAFTHSLTLTSNRPTVHGDLRA